MRWWLFLAAFLTCIGATGCGAQVSKADLGTVIFEVPKVPGTEEPYQMPQLAPSEEENGKPGSSHLP